MYCCRQGFCVLGSQIMLRAVYCFAVDISNFLSIHTIYGLYEVSSTSSYVYD
jgi:hypothetical protein